MGLFGTDCHQCSGKSHLIFNTLRLLVIQVLLNVLGIHNRHNGIQQQALSQEILQATHNTTVIIMSRDASYSGTHHNTRSGVRHYR